MFASLAVTVDMCKMKEDRVRSGRGIGMDIRGLDCGVLIKDFKDDGLMVPWGVRCCTGFRFGGSEVVMLFSVFA